MCWWKMVKYVLTWERAESNTPPSAPGPGPSPQPWVRVCSWKWHWMNRTGYKSNEICYLTYLLGGGVQREVALDDVIVRS